MNQRKLVVHHSPTPDPRRHPHRKCPHLYPWSTRRLQRSATEPHPPRTCRRAPTTGLWTTSRHGPGTPENGGRVRHQRICALDGQRLTASETARGWNTPDGRTVVVTDEDRAALPLPTKRVTEVLGFIDTNDVDPLLYACPYWVGASGPGIIRRSDGQKGFVVLPKRWIVGQRQAKKPKPVRGQRTDVTWAGLSREAWPAAFPSDFGSSGLPRPGRPGRLARRREGDALGAGR
ncbi:Ku protein [Streptomyces sp. NPDC057579]|uniref:Ku protein n=1 Tax=Streptomyces sp. NPDC057579 TaxID=3346172 RepID=UPI00367457EF